MQIVSSVPARNLVSWASGQAQKMLGRRGFLGILCTVQAFVVVQTFSPCLKFPIINTLSRTNRVLGCHMNAPLEHGKSPSSERDSRKAFLSKSLLTTSAALIAYSEKSYAEGSESVKEANKETLIMKTTAGTMTFEFWPEV